MDVTCTDNIVANCDEIPEALPATKSSGIAFYVDLHAHATKRGVFTYGDYFGNHGSGASRKYAVSKGNLVKLSPP